MARGPSTPRTPSVEDNSMMPPSLPNPAPPPAEAVARGEVRGDKIHPAALLREKIGVDVIATGGTPKPLDHYASFVSLKGLSHRITIKRMQDRTMEDATKVGRISFVPNSGLTVKFSEGLLYVSDVKVIEAMLAPEVGLGVDYDLDPKDPTGFWAKYGILEMEEERVLRIKSRVDNRVAQKIYRGALNVEAGNEVMEPQVS